jgi:hypothetical protein
MMTRNRKTICAFVCALLLMTFAGLALPTGSYAQTPTVHRKNWVQRHPTLTAIGAGLATHHALKVAARNAKLHGKRLNWAERHPTLSAVGVGAVTRHEIVKHTPK